MTVGVDAPLIGGDLGMFHSWLSLPRTEEFARKAIMVNLAANAIWCFMFFGLGNFHPLPSSLTSKCKPYDKLVLRHRLV